MKRRRFGLRELVAVQAVVAIIFGFLLLATERLPAWFTEAVPSVVDGDTPWIGSQEIRSARQFGSDPVFVIERISAHTLLEGAEGESSAL